MINCPNSFNMSKVVVRNLQEVRVFDQVDRREVGTCIRAEGACCHFSCIFIDRSLLNGCMRRQISSFHLALGRTL